MKTHCNQKNEFFLKKYSINVYIMQYTDSVKHLLSAQQTAGTVIYL